MTAITVEGPWLTVRQAAARAQRGRRTILNALDDETLRGYRRGERGRWRIHVDDVDAWVRGEKADVQIAGARRAS
jgi:excisionase family DNA binding protein